MNMDELQPQTTLGKFKRFLVECQRVLKVTRKPTGVEFKTIVKVSGLGMAIIGIIGVAVSLTSQIFFR